MSNASFFWHDYETSGTDARRDRPIQFAGQRTSLELEPIGDAVSLYCQPAVDVLPHPAACLITGITPQLGLRDGVIEAEFAARVQEELGLAGTCGVGYNSLRFDDEFTRNLLYRNFYDPYEREWKDGNSRWDLIDLARMCYALRPQGIQWPMNEAGAPSFRLGDLAAANHLAHVKAHDALSDVQATIALARLIRARQPKLWDFFFALRRKQRAFELLDYVHATPVLHVSSRYAAQRGCLAMVLPLAAHPSLPNGIIVFDLDSDPGALLELPADEIADRIFTPRADLPEDIERIALKTVHTNKSPALAPMSALAGVDLDRIGLNLARCRNHLQRLQQAYGLVEKIRQVFSVPRDARASLDVDLAIYAGFVSDADKRLLREVRRTPPKLLAKASPLFTDPRYSELLFRYRARNWPQHLTADEASRWRAFCQARLHTASDATALTLPAYFEAIAALRALPSTRADQLVLLDQLEAWGHARNEPEMA